MFEAPEIFTKIPDIQQIYKATDEQANQLERAVEEMEQNIFFEEMTEGMTERWETMLQIQPPDTDSLNDRRFRIKARAMERLPYSIRVMKRKLKTLCQEGYSMTLDGNNIEIKLALKSKRMIYDVQELMDEVLPLNMTFKVNIMYNRYIDVKKYTYAQLKDKTYRQIREEVMSG